MNNAYDSWQAWPHSHEGCCGGAGLPAPLLHCRPPSGFCPPPCHAAPVCKPPAKPRLCGQCHQSPCRCRTGSEKKPDLGCPCEAPHAGAAALPSPVPMFEYYYIPGRRCACGRESEPGYCARYYPLGKLAPGVDL